MDFYFNLHLPDNTLANYPALCCYNYSWLFFIKNRTKVIYAGHVGYTFSVTCMCCGTHYHITNAHLHFLTPTQARVTVGCGITDVTQPCLELHLQQSCWPARLDSWIEPSWYCYLGVTSCLESEPESEAPPPIWSWLLHSTSSWLQSRQFEVWPDSCVLGPRLLNRGSGQTAPNRASASPECRQHGAVTRNKGFSGFKSWTPALADITPLPQAYWTPELP